MAQIRLNDHEILALLNKYIYEKNAHIFQTQR